MLLEDKNAVIYGAGGAIGVAVVLAGRTRELAVRGGRWRPADDGIPQRN